MHNTQIITKKAKNKQKKIATQKAQKHHHNKNTTKHQHNVQQRTKSINEECPKLFPTWKNCTK